VIYYLYCRVYEISADRISVSCPHIEFRDRISDRLLIEKAFDLTRFEEELPLEPRPLRSSFKKAVDMVPPTFERPMIYDPNKGVLIATL
jgi:hypothetical protein